MSFLRILLIAAAFIFIGILPVHAKDMIVKEPPKSLSKYYPPESKQPKWIQQMHKMSTHFGGIFVNLKEKDYKNVDNHDAMAFIHMLKTPPKEVKVLPPRDFMTYDRHNCVKPTFGIHFPAHDKATRVKNWIKKHKMKIQTGTNTVAIAGKNIYYQIPFNMPSSKIVIGVLSSKKNKRMAMRKIYKNENIYFKIIISFIQINLLFKIKQYRLYT